WEWWQTPLRLYPERTLPALDTASIWAVEIVPKKADQLSPQTVAHRVWIAGGEGLLANSDDRGEHWTMYEYDPASGVMVAPGSPNPPPWQPNADGSGGPLPKSTTSAPSPTTGAAKKAAPSKQDENTPKPPAKKAAAATLWDQFFTTVHAETASTP